MSENNDGFCEQSSLRYTSERLKTGKPFHNLYIIYTSAQILYSSFIYGFVVDVSDHRRSRRERVDVKEWRGKSEES